MKEVIFNPMMGSMLLTCIFFIKSPSILIAMIVAGVLLHIIRNIPNKLKTISEFIILTFSTVILCIIEFWWKGGLTC